MSKTPGGGGGKGVRIKTKEVVRNASNLMNWKNELKKRADQANPSLVDKRGLLTI